MNSSGAHLSIPTSAEVAQAAARFQTDWDLIDHLLYGLCRDYLGHSNRAAVYAKLAMIDRVYAAGMERRVSPPGGRQAIEVIAD